MNLNLDWLSWDIKKMHRRERAVKVGELAGAPESCNTGNHAEHTFD
jgi:hypothetical protein